MYFILIYCECLCESVSLNALILKWHLRYNNDYDGESDSVCAPRQPCNILPSILGYMLLRRLQTQDK
jgi:hypothetical protein